MKDFGVDQYPSIGYSLYEELSVDMAENVIHLTFEADQTAIKAEKVQGGFVEVKGVFVGAREQMSIEDVNFKLLNEAREDVLKNE